MVVRASDPAFIEHTQVKQLPRYLLPNDLLVLNATRVLPARLEGFRADTRGSVQGLYLAPAPCHTLVENSPRAWTALLSGKRLRENVVVALVDRTGNDSNIRLRLLSHAAGELTTRHGAWLVSVEDALGNPLTESDTAILDRVGLTPLPPYIRAARKRSQVETSETADRERYQTTFARDTSSGSVAAPTAGLHLTPELLESLAQMDVRRAEVILHVGLGTFASVETEFIEQHAMHHELCELDQRAFAAIQRARESYARVIAVGTTAARTLESFAACNTLGQLSTNILITPGYHWKWVDALLTNFHLPRSTLMAMVASLLQRGSPSQPGAARLKSLYEIAIQSEYRFYSFGDAMLILP